MNKRSQQELQKWRRKESRSGNRERGEERKEAERSDGRCEMMMERSILMGRRIVMDVGKKKKEESVVGRGQSSLRRTEEEGLM